MVKVKELKELLTCPVCKDIMNEPFTMMCNHTCCYNCLIGTEEHQWDGSRKCPICKAHYCLPPKKIVVNFVMRQIIQKVIGADVYEKIKEERSKEFLSYSMRGQVAKQLREEIYASVLDNIDFREMYEESRQPIVETIVKDDKDDDKWSKITIGTFGVIGGAVVSVASLLLLKRLH